MSAWLTLLAIMTPKTALATAIRLTGGREKLAKKLGVGRTATYHWIDNKIPAEHAAMIEVLTSGEVTLRQLRPDIFKAATRRAAATP